MRVNSIIHQIKIKPIETKSRIDRTIKNINWFRQTFTSTMKTKKSPKKSIYSPKIETFSAEEVELASSNIISVHIDGRPLGHTPVKLRVLPGALRVFAPKHPMAET
jgi:diacylglycerol kinase family enzyme